jgi:hypothetical protein
MLDYLIPKDDEDDSDDQETIRTQIGWPIQKADDREYTPEEVGTAIEVINSKKSPGKDGINSNILQRAYNQFPKLINTIHNQCLRQGCFPKRLKRVKVIRITNLVKKSQWIH